MLSCVGDDLCIDMLLCCIGLGRCGVVSVMWFCISICVLLMLVLGLNVVVMFRLLFDVV